MPEKSNTLIGPEVVSYTVEQRFSSTFFDKVVSKFNSVFRCKSNADANARKVKDISGLDNGALLVLSAATGTTLALAVCSFSAALYAGTGPLFPAFMQQGLNNINKSIAQLSSIPKYASHVAQISKLDQLKVLSEYQELISRLNTAAKFVDHMTLGLDRAEFFASVPLLVTNNKVLNFNPAASVTTDTSIVTLRASVAFAAIAGILVASFCICLTVFVVTLSTRKTPSDHIKSELQVMLNRRFTQHDKEHYGKGYVGVVRTKEHLYYVVMNQAAFNLLQVYNRDNYNMKLGNSDMLEGQKLLELAKLSYSKVRVKNKGQYSTKFLMCVALAGMSFAAMVTMLGFATYCRHATVYIYGVAAQLMSVSNVLSELGYIPEQLDFSFDDWQTFKDFVNNSGPSGASAVIGEAMRYDLGGRHLANQVFKQMSDKLFMVVGVLAVIFVVCVAVSLVPSVRYRKDAVQREGMVLDDSTDTMKINDASVLEDGVRVKLYKYPNYMQEECELTLEQLDDLEAMPFNKSSMADYLSAQGEVMPSDGNVIVSSYMTHVERLLPVKNVGGLSAQV